MAPTQSSTVVGVTVANPALPNKLGTFVSVMALDSDKLAGVFSSRLLVPYSRSDFDLLLALCGKFRWLLA